MTDPQPPADWSPVLLAEALAELADRLRVYGFFDLEANVAAWSKAIEAIEAYRRRPMIEPTITQEAFDLAVQICGCATDAQRKKDIEALLAYRQTAYDAGMLAAGKASNGP